MAAEEPTKFARYHGTVARGDDPYEHHGYGGHPRTTTRHCAWCGKQKSMGTYYGRKALVVDPYGGYRPLCDDCVAREEEAALSDRLVEVHAEWQERLPRTSEFARGDKVEIEGHELTVTRVDEVEVTERDRLAIRVWLKPWGESVPPERDFKARRKS